MKILLLCGGKGTRLFPLTEKLPKPLIPIKGKPIIDYIINYFVNHDLNNFILCTGYKSELIKKHLSELGGLNYTISDSGDVDILKRIKDCENLIEDEFMICYGDTIANINLQELVEFHKSHEGIATMSSFNLSSNFGVIKSHKCGQIFSLDEKPQNNFSINIGYFIFSYDVFKYIHLAKNWIEFLNLLIDEKKIYAKEHKGLHITINTLTELFIAEKEIESFK